MHKYHTSVMLSLLFSFLHAAENGERAPEPDIPYSVIPLSLPLRRLVFDYYGQFIPRTIDLKQDEVKDKPENAHCKDAIVHVAFKRQSDGKRPSLLIRFGPSCRWPSRASEYSAACPLTDFIVEYDLNNKQTYAQATIGHIGHVQSTIKYLDYTIRPWETRPSWPAPFEVKHWKCTANNICEVQCKATTINFDSKTGSRDVRLEDYEFKDDPLASVVRRLLTGEQTAHG